MRFLLIYPPTPSLFIEPEQKFYGVAPPQGLLSIASILEKNNDRVTIIDFSAEPYSDQKILDILNSIDIVGITTLTLSYPQVKHIIDLIKRYSPDTPVILGGPHCTIFPEKTLLETKADIIVSGDGEYIIKLIKEALGNKDGLLNLPGVIYKDNNKIKLGGKPRYIENLDSLPFPSYHLIRKYVYGREFDPSLKKVNLHLS